MGNYNKEINRALLAVLAVGTIAFVAWRFFSLGQTSLWLDEIMQVQVARVAGWEDFWKAIPRDKPPLEYLLLRSWGMEEHSEFRMRLPSAIFGVSLIFCLPWLFSGLRNRLIVAALLASNVLHFVLSQELLPYSSSTFWVTLLFCGLVLFFEKGYWWAAVMAVLGAVVAILTAFTTMFSILGILAGFALWVLWRCRSIPAKKAILILATLGLVTAGIYMPFYFRMQALFENRPVWPFQDIPGILSVLFEAFLSLGGFQNIPLAIIEVIALGAGVVTVWREKSMIGVVCVIWLIAGVMFLLFAFWLQNHWIAPRYFLNFFVPLTLIQVIGISELWKLSSHSSAMLRASLIGILALLFLARAFAINEVQAAKPNYRQETVLLADSDALDLVLTDHEITQYCYGYYAAALEGKFPDAEVFTPGSSFQAAQVGLAGRIIPFPILFSGVPESPDFIRLLAMDKGNGIAPGEALDCYHAPLQFPALSLPSRIEMTPETKPFFMNGWSDSTDVGIATIRRARQRAQIAFLVSPEDAQREWEIGLHIIGGGEKEGETQKFSLRRNGDKVASFTAHAMTGREIFIPIRFEPGLNLLLIEAENQVDVKYVMALEALEFR